MISQTSSHQRGSELALRSKARRETVAQGQRAADSVLIEGDVTRLQQVLVNVLSNAVKFTQTGGAIDVTLQHTSSSVDVTVADSGHGINADFLPHVFDMNMRVRHSGPVVSGRVFRP